MISNFSEWYNRILKEAELVDLRYNVKGFIVILPWAMKVIKQIFHLFENELEKQHHNPYHFPAVISLSNFKLEEEHIKGFSSEVFWIEKAGDNKLNNPLLLRPTSETAIYPMFSLWINGVKDLPLLMYQSGTVWRYETKSTKPFIRGREFLWIETHCAFSSYSEVQKRITDDVNIARHVLTDTLGIPFLFLKRPQWDKFHGAKDTYAFDTLLPSGKVLQISTTHDLHQKFSKPFNISYTDEKGNTQFVYQTCFGIGINRIYASLISWYGDDKGLYYPFHLSPIQVVIVPIYKSNNKEKIDRYVSHLKQLLKKNNITYIYDTSNETPGFKFNKWEMKGVPFRIEVGMREIESNKLVVVHRKLKKKELVEFEKVVDYISSNAKTIFEKEKQKHIQHFNESIHEAETLEQLKLELKKGGFVKVPFCSIDFDGKDCSDVIKTQLQAEIRGVNPNEEKPKSKKCIVCGKDAKHYVYISKAY